MMAQSQAESTWEINNYGRFINQLQPNIIRSIQQFERINKKICRQKMFIIFNQICINEEMLPKYTYIYIYIYIHFFLCIFLFSLHAAKKEGNFMNIWKMQKLLEATDRKRGDGCAKIKRNRLSKRKKPVLFQTGKVTTLKFFLLLVKGLRVRH